MKSLDSRITSLLGRDLAQQIAALGLIVAMLGLGYDVWLHAREGEALADEAIFGLSNPGHVIFGAGLVLTAAGLLLGLVTSNGQRRAPLLSRLTAALLVTVMGGVLAFGFTSPQGHTHPETHSDSEPASVDLTRLGLSQEEILLIETSRHSEDHDEHGPALALTTEELIRLGDELAVAREAGARYASLDYALANGYVQIVQDLPLIGAHFINPRFASDRGQIDFSQPEMLIYTYRDGAWLLYGLSYLSGTNGFEGEVAPEGFTGPFDVWHWHKDWCFTLHGARAVSRDECAKIPGFFVDRTGYMVHVWLVENPNGPFAHAHPGLTGSTEYIVPQFLTGAVPGQTSR